MGDEGTTSVEVTEQQRRIILSALTDKVLDVERYLAGSKVPKQPLPEHTCCDAHLRRYEYQRENYLALKAQHRAVRDTIALFEKDEESR